MRNLMTKQTTSNMTIETLENIVPISDAPNRISIAEKTLRNWRSRGMYPQLFIKLGGKVFVDLNEFAKLVAAQKEKAVAEAKRLGL